MSATLLLTPHGHLQWLVAPAAAPLPEAQSGRIAAAFARSAGHGLLHLGAAEVATALPSP